MPTGKRCERHDSREDIFKMHQKNSPRRKSQDRTSVISNNNYYENLLKNLKNQSNQSANYMIVTNPSKESLDSETTKKVNNTFLPHVERYAESLFNMKLDYDVII